MVSLVVMFLRIAAMVLLAKQKYLTPELCLVHVFIAVHNLVTVFNDSIVLIYLTPMRPES